MPQVRIVRQIKGVDPADPESLRPAVIVTYSTESVPPRTVYVPGEDPDVAQVQDAIRADIAAWQAERSGTLEV